jgi:hypothetical protein
MKLSMNVHLTHGDGSGPGQTPLEYTVLGLPPNQSAQIRDYMGDSGWRILQIKKGVSGGFEGQYKTAEDALAALQEQVDKGNYRHQWTDTLGVTKHPKGGA